ncbi:LysR family transcriptional regulator [Lentzea flaviverrucosa]|uniref:DNA-binding transcriptional regulator, LysR family n=1 Tax=Lentzea flaviverrucosa TaxID=200379 RepID=A0A1H9UME3_9PSEU|nr:LysR family transcriptional regulator [Lentzea flaviverrucosa]RDI27835.1 LysR family transcriptional regulator [Lentzea flaviverrucosa]SES10471.1 DNA-binding transcriptional regulator, LysR family [Lentzea flaviverrucosa]
MQADLNLLTVLDALLEEGSVMGAAERLHLSSPAVSRTLGRIRKVTGDDILVRTGHTMTPTPYALGIADEVSRLVRQANAVLAPSRELDLAELERTFTIQCHDALASSVVPALIGRIAEQAPGVRLRVLAEHSADTDDLRHGRVDLELGGGAPDLPEFRSETLGTDPLAVVMRSGHPCTELDLRAYAAYPHVLVSRRGRLTAPIDDLLAAEGLRRRVIATVATVHSAVQIAAASDALVTTTAILCRPLIEAFGLVTHPLPAESPEAPINCNWHQRYDSDLAHAWLRDQVRTVVGDVLGR